MSTPTSIVVVTLSTSSSLVMSFSVGSGSRMPLNQRCRLRCSSSGLVWPVSSAMASLRGRWWDSQA